MNRSSKSRRAGILIWSLLLLAVTTAHAQSKKIVFNRNRISVGEVIKTVQNQTKYVFAFDSRTLDANRTLTLENRSYDIEEVVGAITAGTDYSYMIKDQYIVINSTPREKKQIEVYAIQRTGDVYERSRLGAVDHNYLSNRTTTKTQPEPEPKEIILSDVAAPAPYSAYNNPNLFYPMQHKLPHVTLKTNLLYGAAAFAPNLGVEIGITPKSTLELWGGYNGWKHSANSSKQLEHFIVRPEYRWWMCERYNGHFIGVNAMYAKYQISQHKIPMLFKKENRYDGYAAGVGFTYGYHMVLGKKWGLEFNVGVGGAYLNYDQYTCALCDRDAVKKTKFYFGPTRAGVSLVFMIK